MPFAPPLDPDRRSLRFFLVVVSLTLVAGVAAGFLGLAFRQRSLIQDAMLDRARSDFQNIVRFREWNAHYGGVYVDKASGTGANPYLRNPDVQTADGRILTRKNPATMTRELAERLDTSEGFRLHITSLRPLNPGNAPDAMEARALAQFEGGQKEAWWTETDHDRTYLRYMAPLKAEPGCMVCHAHEIYRLGDIRGGISVSFDIQPMRRRMRASMWLVLGLGLLTSGLLLGLISHFFRRLVRRLDEARGQLQTLARVDALTGVLNRRAILERLEAELERHRRDNHPLCCLIFDVDHFKRVNDTLGHVQGDSVLVRIAEQARHSLRAYDALGRHGGEEFMVVLPDTDLDTAMIVADRIRRDIAEQVSATAPEGSATVSLGAAQCRPGETVNGLIQRVDAALYQAKAGGRNRAARAD